MRILLMTDGIPPHVLGGAGHIVWETATALRERGHDVHIITASPAESSENIGGIHIHTLQELPLRWAHYRSVFSKRRSEEVLTLIRNIKPDCIHMHTVAWQCGYRWIAKAAHERFPIVATAHDVMHIAYGRILGMETSLFFRDLYRTGFSWNPLRNAYIKRTLRHCKYVFCVSDALREALNRHGIRNLSTLHNGINTDFWKPSSQQEARHSLGLPLDVPIFLFAGRIGIDKGSALVASLLPQDTYLLLAGRANVEEFKIIKDRVRYFPNQNQEQMRLLYAAADLALVPSICLDCFPTICLEAGACGRPVIASTFGGAKEAVIDGKTGWVLNPHDHDVFHSRMEWCSAHRTDLPAFGTAARKHIKDNFSLEQYVTKLEKLYL